MRTTRSKLVGLSIAASAMVMALAGAPLVGFGADHLDAPNFTPPENRPDADINDVYAFEGRDDDNTVLVLSTHPAAGAIAPTEYAQDVKYTIKVDRDGDPKAEIQYVARFGKPKNDGSQPFRLILRKNFRDPSTQRRVAKGYTGQTVQMDGGGKVFAGLRSDPFFFDLAAFQGTVLGMGDREFCDKNATDFFEPLNVNAIVIEVPDRKLGDKIGVWGITKSKSDGRIDRMGRPAINTVFMSGQDKVRFNQGHPGSDYRKWNDEVRSVLKTFSGLDSEGAYTNAQTKALAQILLPDVLTYDTDTKAQGPLNGRALADDVIDVELNIVTGGFPFPGRNAKGAIQSDCVGPHDDYRSSFPYLGSPN